jgi:hypothetical protein
MVLFMVAPREQFLGVEVLAVESMVYSEARDPSNMIGKMIIMLK